MSENSDLRDLEDNEAVQAVLDRVLSYHAGAPAQSVRKELEDGLSSIGESRPSRWLAQQSEAISKADPVQS